MPTKPTLSIKDLANHIQNNLNTKTNSNNTHSYLTYINYSLLKPYFTINNTSKELEQVVKHYDFDRKLKLLLWDGLERIEIACRSVLCMVMIKETSEEQWLSNSVYFTTHDRVVGIFAEYFIKQNVKSFLNKNGISTISEWNNLEKIFKDIYDKKFKVNSYQDLIQHKLYNNSIDTLLKNNINQCSLLIQNFFNVSAPTSITELMAHILSKFEIPFYCIMNKLDFGKTNIIIKNLNQNFRDKISESFSESISETEFISHLECFRNIRNRIAHHEPLCNGTLANINNFSYFKKYNNNSIKSYCELVIFYLDLIAPRNTLSNKIDNLITQYKQKYNIDFSAWGYQ